MHRTIPAITTTALVGFAALEAIANGGSAVSSEAEAIRKAAGAVVLCVETSRVLFGEKAEAISRLTALVDEYKNGHPNDILTQAANNAKRFVRALPNGVSLPEFSVEPDGCISLDWIVSRNCLFSLSVGTNNRLAYAWLDGTNKGYGVENFDGQNISQRLIEGITSVFENGYSAIRVA